MHKNIHANQSKPPLLSTLRTRVWALSSLGLLAVATLATSSITHAADAPPIAVVDSETQTDPLPARGGIYFGQKITFDDNHSGDVVVRVGVWEAGESKTYLENYPFTEYVLMISGLLELTNEDGTSREYKAGDTFVMPKGWSGIWHIKEHMKKQMVQIGDPTAKPTGRPVKD